MHCTTIVVASLVAAVMASPVPKGNHTIWTPHWSNETVPHDFLPRGVNHTAPHIIPHGINHTDPHDILPRGINLTAPHDIPHGINHTAPHIIIPHGVNHTAPHDVLPRGFNHTGLPIPTKLIPRGFNHTHKIPKRVELPVGAAGSPPPTRS